MYTRIVVPLDGDPKNEIALPHVRALALKFNAEVILVSVLPHPVLANFANDRALGYELKNRDDAWQSHLDSIAAVLTKSGIQTTTEIYEGSVGDRILKCAEDAQADLIVMTSTNRNLLGILSLDSDVKWVARHAHVPVLLVSADV